MIIQSKLLRIAFLVSVSILVACNEKREECNWVKELNNYTVQFFDRAEDEKVSWEYYKHKYIDNHSDLHQRLSPLIGSNTLNMCKSHVILVEADYESGGCIVMEKHIFFGESTQYMAHYIADECGKHELKQAQEPYVSWDDISEKLQFVAEDSITKNDIARDVLITSFTPNKGIQMEFLLLSNNAFDSLLSIVSYQ